MKDIYDEMQGVTGITQEKLAGQLVERRLIPLHGEIKGEMADGICKVMLALDLKETAPITLLIDSGGGDVTAANKIGGFIQTLHSPVDGLVIARAASMAVDVLLMCRKRFALPNAELFVHFTRCGFKAVRDSDEITKEDLNTIQWRMTEDKKRREELYMKRLGKTRKQIHNLFRMGEKYSIDYIAEDALKLGLIDEIDTKFKFFSLVQKVKQKKSK